MELDEAVEALASSREPPERQREGLETVRKLLSNILNAPHEAKFRQIKLTNPAIKQRLFPECILVLLASGFKEDGALLVYNRDVGPDIRETLTTVESLILSLEGSATSSSSTSPAAQLPPAEVKKRAQMQRSDTDISGISCCCGLRDFIHW